MSEPQPTHKSPFLTPYILCVFQEALEVEHLALVNMHSSFCRYMLSTPITQVLLPLCHMFMEMHGSRKKPRINNLITAAKLKPTGLAPLKVIIDFVIPYYQPQY